MFLCHPGRSAVFHFIETTNHCFNFQGCRRSYFFVHDLRRHLRQKHGGMDYNEESGQYEAAATDDGGDHQGALGIDSPQSGHGDSDEQSPDSDDEVIMATASLVA